MKNHVPIYFSVSFPLEMRYLLCTLFFSIASLLLNAQPTSEDQYFHIHLTNSIPCTEVKDQSQSSTCWVFATNSLFESDLIKKRSIRLNLSEMFIARHAYIDKAKQYLATKGRTYFEGGGQFHDVIRVVNRYGMLPEEVYNGRVNGEYNHNHARLDTAMRRMGRKFLQQGKTELNSKDLQQVNDTLDRYLGKLPLTFCYELQQYDAKSFAKDMVQFGNDYIEVMSFSDLPLYKKCLLADKFNWAGDSLYNISLNDMQMLVDTALANGWSVGWEGDVTDPGFSSSTGYATLYNTSHNYDEERIQNYKTEVTKRDHMLHLVGIGRDENNREWYYMKNSWGIWFNPFNGYMYMAEDYFKLKTVILMVNKAALPNSLKNKLGIN